MRSISVTFPLWADIERSSMIINPLICYSLHWMIYNKAVELDNLLLRREAQWIYRFRATQDPGLNNAPSFKPFLYFQVFVSPPLFFSCSFYFSIDLFCNSISLFLVYLPPLNCFAAWWVDPSQNGQVMWLLIFLTGIVLITRALAPPTLVLPDSSCGRASGSVFWLRRRRSPRSDVVVSLILRAAPGHFRPGTHIYNASGLWRSLGSGGLDLGMSMVVS